MIRPSTKAPTFFDDDENIDLEETGLLELNWSSSGSPKQAIAFEIEQARQRKRRPGGGGGTLACLSDGGGGRIHRVLAVSVLANLVGLVVVVVHLSNGRYIGTSTGFMPTRRAASSNHSDTIYGHVHMVKTAGTNLNGLLASRYDHVCGNKGYSLDYYEYNERVRNSTNHDVRYVATDSISNRTNNPTMNRGRLPFEIVQEIGFQDCDYISLEHSWEIWPQLRKSLPKRFKLELHVPCRAPLDHLMSMCQYRDWDFDCGADNLGNEIEACVFGMDRFSLKLETIPNVALKCFASLPVEPYIEYMRPRLESRRIPAAYVQRDSNGAGGPRDDITKRGECLGLYPHIDDQVEQLLLEKYDYYQWCDECLDLSENDLLSP
jgi:hypothetical protein